MSRAPDHPELSAPGHFINGAYVIPTPVVALGMLGDLDLVYEIVPAGHRIATTALWLRLKCERPRMVKSDLLRLLCKLWVADLVEYHGQLGWRKVGEGTRD